MRVLVPVLLATLALLDGCFCGFRAAAGRDARIAKRGYAAAAVRDRAVAGAAVLLALTACSTAALALEPGRYDAFVLAGQRMLLVMLPYAVLVLLALVGYVAAPRTSAQTLMSTLILGPFTLARPLVVVAAVLAGGTVADTAVRAAVVVSGLLVLAVEPLLRRRLPPVVPHTAPPWASAA